MKSRSDSQRSAVSDRVDALIDQPGHRAATIIAGDMSATHALSAEMSAALRAMDPVVA
jgi:hypothetical protein